MSSRCAVVLLVVAVWLQTACADPSSGPARGGSTAYVAADGMDAALQGVMQRINASLSASGAAYRVGQAQWMGTANTPGRQVLFSDVGRKEAEFHWVPNDLRRGGHAGLTYAIDQVDGAPAGLTVAQTTAAIDAAMATWNGLTCAHIPLIRQPNMPGVDLGLTQFILGLGGSPVPVADITHAGWLPGSILPGPWLGVTFTYYFLTDVNGDGRYDDFIAETYYNSDFSWGIDPPFPVADVQSVALHESGHALDLVHYGKLFVTLFNDKAHWAPFAVMNPAYSAEVHGPQGTDVAGFCGQWGRWPNK